ncbi:disease resistance protein RGA5-like [Triticum aestivum]|uniref:Putative disease resistance protein n=1 Tax=Aegilops tauschii TaxID=37682 RepID=R7VYG1_AEGTA|nr:disease resistance protein RGA5-like [Triticum aestivum]
MAVSATTGVMNPLLGKLTKLLDEEYKKFTGVRKQVFILKDELSAMKALLDKMELMDKLDSSAKDWREHIRDMTYDMDNCIDDFMHDIECAHGKKGFVRKMAQRLKRLGRRHQIANRIEELKDLAVEANARRERYKIDDCINSSHDIVLVDPRMTAIYKEAASLVGIDGPREELVSLLMDSHKKLKVVSIVGFGGLGKTTLAKQVYDEIGGRFNCKAFVSVSQRPDMKSLLDGLQFKLGMEESSHAHELQDFIDGLREYLKDKRPYFLYLGMYPEDREIYTIDLVRQWIAEGFICNLHGQDLDGVARSYFNDLINRSLIQPGRTFCGKCTEDNFISVAYNYEDIARLHSCKYKVRRLSLQSSVSATSKTLATSMSQVRSYARFGESMYTTPLSQFKYLRVLLFEFSGRRGTSVDLTAIGHLFLLRYLKIDTRFADLVLPTEIQGLVHLETLHVSCCPTQSFPSDIVRLLHLKLPYGTVLPEGIQNMQSVRDLHCTGMPKTLLEDVKGLGKLTNVEDLKLCTPYDQFLVSEQVDALVSSIGMLRDLRRLTLDCKIECEVHGNQLESLLDPPPRIELLNLETWEPRHGFLLGSVERRYTSWNGVPTLPPGHLRDSSRYPWKKYTR